MDEHAVLYRYARNEDGPAFGALVRRYEPIVRSAALRQVRDPHMAGDITQATMMTLMRKAGTIRRQQPLGPWLLRVTHYLAIDAMRNTAMRRHHEQQAARQRHECELGESPWRHIAPILDTALHALSDEDRNILTLRYLQDWSVESIAGELRINSSAVRQRLSRALRRLREVLSDRGINRGDLIPAIPFWLIYWRRFIARIGYLLSPKGLVASLTVVIIFGGSFVITRATMRKSITTNSSTPAPSLVGQRAKSTIP
ncbi:MAG TPA: sigma-70 family RNA polymerase sigma factor [Tepidisphaeraceae bacterium]